MEILLDFACCEWIQSYKRNIHLKASISVFFPSKISRIVEAQSHAFTSQGFAFLKATQAKILNTSSE